MKPHEVHLSDVELISSIDGELSRKDEIRAQSHLTACWTCRTRRQELESAIGDFVRVHRDRFDGLVPPPDGPRALLKARLAQAQRTRLRAAGQERNSLALWVARSTPRPFCAWSSKTQAAERRRAPRFFGWRHGWPWQTQCAAFAAFLVFAGAVYLAFHAWNVRTPEKILAVTKPDPNLTPGATVLLSQRELCRESNTKNKSVPVSLQRRIFHEYGIYTRKANTYEVDYLITPALGGADDIHNLWPQSRRATAWNAAVKDALEDHLRDMVCDGQIDLAVAQHDMAADWIQAYKKYFHTDRPLTSYR